MTRRLHTWLVVIEVHGAPSDVGPDVRLAVERVLVRFCGCPTTRSVEEIEDGVRYTMEITSGATAPTVSSLVLAALALRPMLRPSAVVVAPASAPRLEPGKGHFIPRGWP